MATGTSVCFEKFKENVKSCEDITLIEGVDYQVDGKVTITFKGQYHKELKRDWDMWLSSWFAAVMYCNMSK